MDVDATSNVIVEDCFHPWWFNKVIDAFNVGSDQVC